MKVCSNSLGHMTKMAAMPIYCKNPLKNLLQNQKAGDLGTWYVALGMWGLPSCYDDDPRLTLTYLTSRPNLHPNAYKRDFFLKVYFLKTVEAKVIILT